jgi:hypothetical protein
MKRSSVKARIQAASQVNGIESRCPENALLWKRASSRRLKTLHMAINASVSRHHPPPGRRIAPPDDRLQRMIQYSRDVGD